jgi:hypothetical protein
LSTISPTSESFLQPTRFKDLRSKVLAEVKATTRLDDPPRPLLTLEQNESSIRTIHGPMTPMWKIARFDRASTSRLDQAREDLAVELEFNNKILNQNGQ